MITIRYPIQATTLAQASLIFFEQKLLMRLCIWPLNILAALLFVLLGLKCILAQPTIPDILVLLGAALWLFARKRLNQRWFLFKMRHHRAVGKTLTIEASANGIIWSGAGLAKGHIAWRNIRRVLTLRNGILVPTSPWRFLWLPFAACKTVAETKQLQQLCQAAGVKNTSLNKTIQ